MSLLITSCFFLTFLTDLSLRATQAQQYEECLIPVVSNGFFLINGEEFDQADFGDDQIPAPIGTVILLRCRVGFQKLSDGHQSSTCRLNGTWSPQIGSCQPATLKVAIFETTTAPEVAATVIPGFCLLPFTTFGQLTVNGEPYDHRYDAGDIPVPPKTTIILQCDDGSTSFATCQSDGSWNPPVASCNDFPDQPQDCILPNIEHAEFLVNGVGYAQSYGMAVPLPFGTSILMRCTNGLPMTQSGNSATCADNGIWAPPITSYCKTPTTDCLLPVVRNGYFLVNGKPLNNSEEAPLPLQTNATLICDDGYTRLTEDGTKTPSVCGAGGTWTPNIGECIQIIETTVLPPSFTGCKLPKLITGNFLINGELYDDESDMTIYLPTGTSISLTCPSRNAPSTSAPAICQEDGSWSPQVGHCLRLGGAMECILPVIDNGIFRVNDEFYDSLGYLDVPMPFDTRIVLTCLDGYVLSNGTLEASVCIGDGSWKPPAIGECVAVNQSVEFKDCSLRRIRNAVVEINGERYDFKKGDDFDLPLPSGTKVNVTCLGRYSFTSYDPTNNTLETSCQPDGNWGPAIGRCVAVKLTTTPKPKTTTTKATTTTTTTPPPRCLLPKADNGRLLVNGDPYATFLKKNSLKDVSGITVPIGSEVQIVCLDEYELIPPDGVSFHDNPNPGTSICKPNGQWRPEIGTCSEITFVTKFPGQWTLSPLSQRSINKRFLAAADQGDVRKLSNLLEIGAYIEAKDRDNNNYTALIYGTLKDNWQEVKLLLDRGANIEGKDGGRFGRTPLIWASYLDRKEIVDLLIERGANITAIDLSNSTSLLYAARFGYREVVRNLLDRGANLTDRDSVGCTPLILAAKYGHPSVARELLDRGANISETDLTNGASPLMWAAHNSQYHVASLLIERGADVYQRAEKGRWEGRRVLQLSAAGNVSDLILSHYPQVPHLRPDDVIVRGDKFSGNKGSVKRLVKAAANGELELMRYFLNSGVAIDAHDENGYTALISAASNGQLEAVRFLLERGASVEARDSADYTALIWASVNGQVETARLLLRHPGSTSEVTDATENVYGGTALMWAASQGNEEIVKLLLDQGASADLRVPRGWLWSGNTALMLAARSRHRAVVHLLLSRNASRAGCVYSLCIND